MVTGKRTRNARAVEVTIAALRTGGRLEPVDAATVALVRTLAHDLDEVDPGGSPAQLATLARAQLAALKLLRGVNDTDDGDDFAEFIAAMRGEMGDAPES